MAPYHGPFSTLHYITVYQVIRVVAKLGPGAFMGKFDVEAAYRNVPIHPSHRVLLGMKWHNHFYVDLALPFGLRSAPFIFNYIADMVEWILVTSYQIPVLLIYLDDFITAGPAQCLQCAQNLATALEVCQRLGLPLHPGKVCQPLHSARCPRYRARLCQPSGVFPPLEVVTAAQSDWFMAPSKMVQQT